VVTLLVICSNIKKNKIEKSIERTIKNKIKKGRKYKKEKKSLEIKGTNTTIQIKEYFWSQIKKSNFELYTLILNKQRVYENLGNNKDRLYNFVSRLLLEKVKFSNATTSVNIIIDRSKNKEARKEFNNYLFLQLKGFIDPKIPLHIFQPMSHENKGLQAVDMFSWGIFRKYERKDFYWYRIFKERIVIETKYLP
jgi:predicted DNA-binding ribbon-helix-helix protein